MKKKQKILVIAVSGIGNTILQSPAIKALFLRDYFQVDVLFGNQAMANVFWNEKRIHHKYILPKGFAAKIRLVQEFRKNQYDYAVACFPSNRMEFHMLMFLSGAKRRVIHSYRKGRWRTLSFLSNLKIPADSTLHDVEQNLNLLTVFNIEPARVERQLVFNTEKAHRNFADSFIETHQLGGKTIFGLHAGCKKSEEYRRWPADKFIALIERLNQNSIHCLLFGGPDEKDVTLSIFNGTRNHSINHVVEENDINNIGALIQKCHCFLTTDSGLGHIAAAQGVDVYAIFGPAQASRTAPYGAKGHYISLDLPCSPCMGYPFTATHSKIKCPYEFKCLRTLNVEDVFNTIME
ncbi:MAG: glycosyltransferase family 9 protein [Candidatus Omnitrophica bacterium]|nr:glycosyltransferase family 9 protein [Candidatus Omnitrophota bacterium]